MSEKLSELLYDILGDSEEDSGIIEKAIALEAELELFQNRERLTGEPYGLRAANDAHRKLKASLLSTNAALKAKLEAVEGALYNCIEEGVAHAFLDIDHDTKRARVTTQEALAAAQEQE